MSAESLDGFIEAGVSAPPVDDFFIRVNTDEIIKDGSVDRRLRVTLALSLMLTVCLINFSVFYLINKYLNIEVELITEGLMNASERVINENVFLALIAAVVAEITPVLILVVKHLFSGKK